MLPDFPELKAKLASRLRARMKSVHASQTVPFSAAGIIHIPEGDRLMTIDEDGVESEVPMKEHRVALEFSADEIESLEPVEIIRRFDQAAREMAIQTGKTFVESLDRAVQSVGNVMTYRGSLTGEDLLAMWDHMLIEFDDAGRPCLPTLLCGQQLHSQLMALLPQLECDPDFQERYKSLMARKREEWRDRESDRKLVG
jgi:hypothetical protein